MNDEYLTTYYRDCTNYTGLTVDSLSVHTVAEKYEYLCNSCNPLYSSQMKKRIRVT